MAKTRLSSKGQVIIPREIRAARRLAAGVVLEVEDTPSGILLRPVSPFPVTSVGDLVGCTGYRGPRRSLADMEAAIARGARA